MNGQVFLFTEFNMEKLRYGFKKKKQFRMFMFMAHANVEREVLNQTQLFKSHPSTQRYLIK